MNSFPQISNSEFTTHTSMGVNVDNENWSHDFFLYWRGIFRVVFGVLFRSKAQLETLSMARHDQCAILGVAR